MSGQKAPTQEYESERERQMENTYSNAGNMTILHRGEQKGQTLIGLCINQSQVLHIRLKGSQCGGS